MSFKVTWYDSQFHQYEEIYRSVIVDQEGNLCCEDEKGRMVIIRLWVKFELVKE